MINPLIFLGIVVLVLIFATILFVMSLRDVVKQTRLEGKRYFGLNCDSCSGKQNSKGKPLIRCMIKPHILKVIKKWGIAK